MHTNAIPSDSTIKSIWHQLEKPDVFTADVMGRMHGLRPRGLGLVVRIGVTGTGKRPNYRVEDVTEAIASVAYNGDNHEPFPADEQVASSKTWSSASMTYLELADLRKTNR